MLKNTKNGVRRYMIKFLGCCAENFWKTLKYIFSGETKFSSILTQAAMISYDSLSIALTIVFIASAVITLQVAEQFLLTGACRSQGAGCCIQSEQQY